MKRIELLWHTLEIYADDHGGFFPSNLVEFAGLYPRYIPDAGIFYCPSDADKKPETIDNSMLNAPNSSQISYLYHQGYKKTDPDNKIILQDNTVDNHEGEGGHVVRLDGSIEWTPKGVAPY